MGKKTTPDGFRLGEPGINQGDVGQLSDDGNRSPLLTARRAGSGKFVPCAANPTGMVVAIVLPNQDPGGLPPGTLLTVDEPAPADVGLKNALEAPYRSLGFATGQINSGHLLRAGVIALAADLILAQLGAQLQVGQRLLDGMVDDAPSQADRIRAREHLDTLSRWVSLAMATRSGGDADAPLDLPESVVQAATALVTTGGRLRHYWREGKLAAKRDNAVSIGQRVPESEEPAEQPLTDRERMLLEVLSDLSPGQGMTGKQILQEFAVRSFHGVDQRALTTRIIIPMRKKQGWDIPNDRRNTGYYLSTADRARFARMDAPSST